MSSEDGKKIQTLQKYYRNGIIKKKEELFYDDSGKLKKKIEIKYHRDGKLKKKAEFNYPDTIVLESRIAGIGINPNTNKLYVSSGDFIFVIDGNTYKTLDKIKIKNPSSIIINQKTNKLYVFSRFGKKSQIVVIDLFLDKVTDIIFGNFKNPDCMSIDYSKNILYVTEWYGADTISVIHCDTNFITDRIKAGRGKHAVTVDEDRNLVYVTNANDDKVSILDGFTKKIIAEIDVKEPVDVFINPGANILYIKSVKGYGCEGASWIETYLQLFDSKTYDILERRMLDAASPVNVIASHGKMFLTVDNTFKKLDSRANEIESVTWGTILGDMMVFNPNTNKIYIAYEYLEKIHVIDTS